MVVWVAALERGRQTGDFELIRRATDELARLGVLLTFLADRRPGACDPGTTREER